MSKTGAVGRAIGSLLSFFTRLTISILQYVALFVSIGVTIYTIGDYTKRVVHDKKAGKVLHNNKKLGLLQEIKITVTIRLRKKPSST